MSGDPRGQHPGGRDRQAAQTLTRFGDALDRSLEWGTLKLGVDRPIIPSAMTPQDGFNPLGLAEDQDYLSNLIWNRIPAVPPLPAWGSVSWLDAASGAGGALRIRHDDESRQLDRDLRVILLDGHTVAFWLTADGRRLGWLRAASA